MALEKKIRELKEKREKMLLGGGEEAIGKAEGHGQEHCP